MKKISLTTASRLLALGLACLLIVGLSSCSSSAKESKPVTASSIGQPCEVLLVLDKESMAGDVKDTLKSLLECDIPGLNQSEPYFRVSRVPKSIYKGEMLKMHTKLLVEIVPGTQAAELKVAYNVDARPQIQVLLTAPSEQKLKEYLRGNADKLRQVLLDHQLSMLQAPLKRHHSKEVRKALKTMGLDGLLPEEITFTKTGENFLWGSSRTSEKQLNFVVYRYASDGSELTDVDKMCQVRDSVMQLNIPGSQPDQWMETVWEQEAPVVWLDQRIRNGSPVAELRGLWQMRHGAMGGPFVSYSQYDERSGQVTVLEGFVFSPSTDKRDLVRRLEAGMRTVE